MRYTISIDQIRSQEWKLTLSEAAVFDFCTRLASWAEPMLIDGQVWYFASRNKVIEELPIITQKPDTIYRIYKALDEKGAILWQKHDGKDCVQITEKGKAWNSEKNPNDSHELGKKSELTRKKIRINSEKNPTNNNTIDKDTIDKRENARAKTENQPTEQPAFPPPPGSAQPPAPEAFFAPDKHERAAEEIIRYLEENRMYLNGMENGDWRRAVRGHCLKLQKQQKWNDLAIPTTEGQYFSWIGSRIAGAKSWYQVAAEYDKNEQNRTNVSTTPRKEDQGPRRLVSEETHRRAFALTLAELGITGGEE